MAKLYYSDEESLTSVLSSSLTEVSKLLGACRDLGVMMVPHDFPALSFLKTFPSRIDSFNSELNSIYQEAASTDATIRGLREASLNSLQSLDISLIDVRERLIR